MAMKQFVVLIRSHGDPLAQLSAAQQRDHVTKATEYIGGLMQAGTMKSALPLEVSGAVLQGSRGDVSRQGFEPQPDPVVGYYLLESEDLDTVADTLAKDPRFGGSHPWTMEVRPVLAVPGISD